MLQLLEPGCRIIPLDAETGGALCSVMLAIDQLDLEQELLIANGDQFIEGGLDPFYQACREGYASGMYRLEEVAPDHFRQSDYFLNYFHDNVLEDEVQFILQVPGTGTLSLSLGMQRRFSLEETGLMTLLAAWVLPLMQQHWQQSAQRAPTMHSQVRDALSQFGTGVLSERELEVARLVLRGFSSKAMAERLKISPDTVKVHRRHLYAKLDISSQPELFSLFIQSLGHDLENP